MRSAFKGYLSATLSLIVLAAAVCAIPALAAYQNPVGWTLIGAYMGAMIAPIAVLFIGVAALLSFAVAIVLPHGGARMVVALFEIAVILLGGPCAAAAFWYGARPDRPITAKQAALQVS